MAKNGQLDKVMNKTPVCCLQLYFGQYLSLILSTHESKCVCYHQLYCVHESKKCLIFNILGAFGLSLL